MSERFYDFLIEYDINFISANALWLMALGFLNGADDYSWDKKINKIFDDTDCVGILTAGKVMKSSNGFRIDQIGRASCRESGENAESERRGNDKSEDGRRR